MRTTTKSRATRLTQAALLGVGALALYVLVDRGDTPFFWTPAILGLTYLAAAAAGGRDGGHWATACGLLGWGVAVLWIGEVRPSDVDPAGAYLLGAGLGAVAGALLARAGFAVDALGLGVTIAAGGAALAFASREDLLVEAGSYAIALVAVAAVNVALALRPARR